MFRKTKPGIQNRQRGFSLVTAIFILVILAGLGASMVTFSTAQHSTVAMDIQSARAYQAARAGIEWGAYQALKNSATYACTPTAPPPSTGTSTDTMTVAGFITTVTCNATSHTEGANTVVASILISSASYGVLNTPDYVRRDISARVASCTNASGTC